MKTAEEKAEKYAEETILALYSDWGLLLDFVQKQKKYAKVDFLAGYNEATRWRDPKEELPKEGEEVQLKLFDTYHNKQEYTHDVYMGGRWRLCESKYIDVLGWRPIK